MEDDTFNNFFARQDVEEVETKPQYNFETMTNSEIENLWAKMQTGEITLTCDAAGLYQRLAKMKSGNAENTDYNQTPILATTQCTITITGRDTEVASSRSRLPVFSEDASDDTYKRVFVEPKSIHVSNLTTSKVGAQHAKRMISANLLSNLRSYTTDPSTPLKLPDVVPSAKPYTGMMGLAVLQQQQVVSFYKDRDTCFHKIASDDVTPQAIGRVWQSVEFPTGLTYKNYDDAIMRVKINKYAPMAVASPVTPVTSTLKTVLQTQAELARNVVGKNGLARASRGHMTGLRLSTQYDTSIRQVLDTAIPDGTSVITVVNGTLPYCYHLRNLLLDARVLIVRSTGDLLPNHDNIVVKNSELVKVKHTVLLSGVTPPTSLQTLHISFAAPQRCTISKNAVVYESELANARKTVAANAKRDGIYQHYVGALDLLGGEAYYVSAQSHKGYAIHRSWDASGKMSSLEVARVMLSITRQKALYPYTLIPSSSFSYMPEGTQVLTERKTFRFPPIECDFRSIYYPDAGDESVTRKEWSVFEKEFTRSEGVKAAAVEKATTKKEAVTPIVDTVTSVFDQ